MSERESLMPRKSEIDSKWEEFYLSARDRYFASGCTEDHSKTAPRAFAAWLLELANAAVEKAVRDERNRWSSTLKRVSGDSVSGPGFRELYEKAEADPNYWATMLQMGDEAYRKAEARHAREQAAFIGAALYEFGASGDDANEGEAPGNFLLRLIRESKATHAREIEKARLEAKIEALENWYDSDADDAIGAELDYQLAARAALEES